MRDWAIEKSSTSFSRKYYDLLLIIKLQNRVIANFPIYPKKCFQYFQVVSVPHLQCNSVHAYPWQGKRSSVNFAQPEIAFSCHTSLWYISLQIETLAEPKAGNVNCPSNLSLELDVVSGSDEQTCLSQIEWDVADWGAEGWGFKTSTRCASTRRQ